MVLDLRLLLAIKRTTLLYGLNDKILESTNAVKSYGIRFAPTLHAILDEQAHLMLKAPFLYSGLLAAHHKISVSCSGILGPLFPH